MTQPAHLVSGLPPWEQQPDESGRAFEAFRAYRDLDPGDRSYRKVAEQLRKSPSLIGRWSSQHRWVERAEAWDREQDRLWQAGLRRRRSRIVDRHLAIANAALVKVTQRLVNLDAEKLSAVEVTRMLEVVTRIEREALTLGQPIQHEISGPAGEPLTVQLAEFAQMGAEQRRLAIADMVATVQRRVKAAAGLDDDDDDEPPPG